VTDISTRAAPRPIYELRRGQCRYAVSPSDAREFLFCAEPVEYEGCPYCPEHAARCFDRRSDAVKRAHAERMATMRAARQAGRTSFGIGANALPPRLRRPADEL